MLYLYILDGNCSVVSITDAIFWTAAFLLVVFSGIVHEGGYHMAKNESAENYLETILILSKKLPVVRSVDIDTELGYKKSSVSVAMKHLREHQHITVTDAGFIYLTESGKEIADMIYERHELLSSWLMHLGVPEEIATEDACKMEHVISKESFEAIKKHVGALS